MEPGDVSLGLEPYELPEPVPSPVEPVPEDVEPFLFFLFFLDSGVPVPLSSLVEPLPVPMLPLWSVDEPEEPMLPLWPEEPVLPL